MSSVTKSTHTYTAERVTLHSALSIDEVVKRLDTELKRDVNTRSAPADRPGRETAEAFEKRINGQVGEKGFMFFNTFAHSEWFVLFAPSKPRKTITYVLGNPLIARTMLVHDQRAGLNVPLRVLVIEAEGGNGTDVVYDLPSSIISVGQAGDKEGELRKAAEALSEKAEVMLRGVLGEQ